MIQLHQVTVNFGVVRGLYVEELKVHERGILGVLGPNGSGKSTLLRVLAGLQSPSSGEVRGLPLPGKVVLVHQEPYFFTGTVRDNLAYALRLAGRDVAEASGWLQRAGAVHLADRPAQKLSVGEQRRLAIVRALAVHPQVLLLDEPFAGLDAEHLQLIQAELAAFEGALVVAAPDLGHMKLKSSIHLSAP